MYVYIWLGEEELVNSSCDMNPFVHVCVWFKENVHLLIMHKRSEEGTWDTVNNSCSGNGVRKLNRGFEDILFTHYILDLIFLWGHESIYNKESFLHLVWWMILSDSESTISLVGFFFLFCFKKIYVFIYFWLCLCSFARAFSGCSRQAWLPWGMWNFPGPGIELCLLLWQADS